MGSSVGGFFGETLGSAGLYTMLSFNRDMETSADTHALRIMAHHYGHLGGADEFFSKLHDEDDIEWLEFTRTHPNTRATPGGNSVGYGRRIPGVPVARRS